MNNIILCGFMGSGKTSIGKELAKLTGYNFIDTDELIEQEQGIKIKEIFEKYGEQHFRDLEYETCKKIANINNSIVSTGGGLMTYQRNSEAIKIGGRVIFLDVSFSTICQRIGEDSTRPLFQDRIKARKLYDERQEKYRNAADYIVKGEMSIEETAEHILKLLEKNDEKDKSECR